MTRRGWLLFAAMSLIWGAPYLFISIAGEYVNPFVLVLLRTGLASLVLVPIVLLRGQARIMVQRWRPILAFAASRSSSLGRCSTTRRPGSPRPWPVC